MPRITLPDGSVRPYDRPIRCDEIAADISPGLARAAVGARVDGVLCDLTTLVEDDAEVSLVTATKGRPDADPDALMLIRHSCAHVMAEAIQRLFPEVQLVYGPPLETGFYYDMAVPEDRPISSEDFEAIEKEMKRIVEEDRPFTRVDRPVPDGLAKLEAEGSKYKVDNARRAIDGGATELSWYVTGTPGEHWEDLCRGPHVPSTGRIGAFKVMSIAASYWHGDADSDRLTRVYGTAFVDRKQLKAHLVQLEEARKRDHRLLGKQLNLFHLDEAVGPGLVLWAPNGAIVRQELERFISTELTKQGYFPVYTPHIGKLDLYRTSGHFPYYQESQFPPLLAQEQLSRFAKEGCTCAELSNRMAKGDIEGYLLKPMNCPHHIKIFASQPHSYRDLPVRLAEFGTVYRWEQSGEIGGMTRVRCFTQDDAHLFCTEEQVAEELQQCLSLVKIIFTTLGMTDYRVRVSLRDPDSSKYVGDPANWDKAEEACRAAARSLGAPFSEEVGEAAFYGPKIDFVVKDVVGREWQLGTVQVDYNLPERFDLTYIGPDNQPHRPVMIHRAPFGSFERFVAVLIEHFAGAFPTWLAPEQVRVLPISDKSLEYARRVQGDLKAAGIRAGLDASSERIQAKVKVAADAKIPYQLVVGPRDAERDEVSVRARGVRHDLGAIDRDACVETLAEEVAGRGAVTLRERHFAEALAT
ncbi:MAG: threonine--tRNA ligase [Phycisphaerales bacterium]|nr:threonine--tRNA ligase [Phycisphaerales bacterium]NNM26963.1 threonine--tRNA ligase [Phycisphaerales bacterium]